MWSSSSALQLEAITIERAASNQSYAKKDQLDVIYSSGDFLERDGSKYQSLSLAVVVPPDAEASSGSLGSFASAAPGVCIATILNLFLSISFGSAFFPAQWTFPPTVSRTLGVQMFLLSTAIGQLVMTWQSEFRCAVAMMMVENISFMTTISLSAIAKQGEGEAAFATVFMANAIMSVSVGVCFFLCGSFKAGYLLNIIPKSLILGCIGGIGCFICKVGVEVSSGQAFAFTGPTAFFSQWKYWSTSALFGVLLRLLQHVNAANGSQLSQRIAPVLAPLYFCAIPGIFYALLCIISLWVGAAGMGPAEAWYFPKENLGQTDYAACFRLLNVRLVDWGVIGQSVPTIIASTVFAFLHVPVNIPALKVTTGEDVDMDSELRAHGISNLLSGFLGQCQNYLCYSNSVLYYKCQGGGRLSSLAVAASSLAFFFAGPSVIQYVPRVMPGCLLIHIGLELLKEAVVDSIAGFDAVEYMIILALTIITATLGITVGLCVGVITAALAFIVQTNMYINPIRRVTRCSTMRSSRWRSVRAQRLLPALNQRVLWLQLQGSLFFANAQLLGKELDKLLLESSNLAEGAAEQDDARVLMVVIDFTLVLSIDASAVDAIKELAKVAERHSVAVVYVRGSKAGFPCTATLTDSLRHIGSNSNSSSSNSNEGADRADSTSPTRKAATSTAPASKTTTQEVLAELRTNGYYCSVYIVDEIDAAIMLCEDRLLHTHTDLRSQPQEVEFQLFLRQEPPHFYQLLHILPNPRQLASLMRYFEERPVKAGEVLWRQGDASSCAILLVAGSLRSDESELSVLETISPGHLVGEFGLLKGDHRHSSLEAAQDSVVLELTLSSFAHMQNADPDTFLLLNRVCLAYLDARTRHVSNFLLHSRSLPV